MPGRIWNCVLLLLLHLAIAASGKEYTVQAGDTLSGIAAAELRDSSRWPEIAELNTLAEPYALAVGQRLTLPATKLAPDAEAAEDDANAPAPPLALLLTGGVLGIVLITSFLYVALYTYFIRRAAKARGLEAGWGRCILLVLATALNGLLFELAIEFLTPAPPVAEADIPWLIFSLLFCGYFWSTLGISKIILRCGWWQAFGVQLRAFCYWAITVFVLAIALLGVAKLISLF